MTPARSQAALTAQLDLLTTVRAEHAAIEKRLKTAYAGTSKAIQTFAQTASAAQRALIARDLYWNHRELEEGQLAEDLGYESIQEMISDTDHQPVFQCGRCEKWLHQKDRHSRPVRQWMHRADEVCEPCVDILRAEFTAEEYRAPGTQAGKEPN